MTTVVEDETLSDWADIPLFAPQGAQIPNLSGTSENEVPSEALGALSHLLYDEETPEEASEYLRTEGNLYFKRKEKRSLRVAVEKYSEALEAAKGETASETAALNNRAATHLKLENYGHALKDALRASELTPSNVKAHFRVAVAATHLEKLDVASRAVKAGLDACKEGNGTKADAKSLKQQSKLISDTKKRTEDRENRKKQRQSCVENVNDMITRRSIRLGRPEYAQQTEYKRSRPELVENEWCWPVLLVYQSPAHGDQSDYLESVGEGVTMTQLVELVFGDDVESPWWDVDRVYTDVKNLKVLVRKEAGQGKNDGSDDDDDDDDGWRIQDQVEWIEMKQTDSVGDLVCKEDYTVPLYPVLHVVPKGIANKLTSGRAQEKR